MNQIETITLSGYKSIKHLELDLERINIFIGANGAGKSNLISFFRLLNWMTFDSNLQPFIERKGGASEFLYYGPKTTISIDANLLFRSDTGLNEYGFELIYSRSDRLFFEMERIRYSDKGQDTEAEWQFLGSGGHREAQIAEHARYGNKTARFILHNFLKRCIVYQFHDTSDTARVKRGWNIDDNRYLRDDAANLAPVLYRLREEEPKYYTRIVHTLRSIIPFFIDFELNFNRYSNQTTLQWREQGPDPSFLFSAHQASDGTLRTMALVTLLMQPPSRMPNIIILDEPELGLHPYAVDVLARLIHAASLHSQILLATQSVPLIDYFDPENIIVVERDLSGLERPSIFQRLDSDNLSDWLEEYSLSELWEKNVLGGTPR